jgi:hypothetical protein
VWAGLGVVALLAGVLWGVIIAEPAGLPGGRAAFDQDYYHLRAVRDFAEQWPGFDLVNYRSATTPGYHLVLASVARFVCDSTVVLRLVGSVFTLGLVLVLALHLSRRVGALALVALVLPLGTSLYVIGPGAWLLPDNAAWLGVLAILIFALDRAPSLGMIAFSGACLLGLVLVRQIHLWAAGVVWLAAWLGTGSSPLVGTSIGQRLRGVAPAILATIPAGLIVLGFIGAWGGMVPPLFQPGSPDPVFRGGTMTLTGGNPATPAFLLVLVGIYSVFFLAWWMPGLRRLAGRERAVVLATIVGGVVGLVLATIPETSFNMDKGRSSGFWALAARLPTVAERSTFIVLGSMAGGAMLGVIACVLPRRDSWILLGSLAGFMLAQAASAFAWQRYLEPMVLMVLILSASRVEIESSPGTRAARWAPLGRWIGPILLAGILAMIAWRQLGQLPDIAGAA